MNNKVELKPEKWVENYADAMYAYAASRLSNSNIAEDLVQETFLAALKAIESFRSDSSEKTWLFSILKRKIIDYYRKASSKYEQSFSQISPFENTEHIQGNWKSDRVPLEWEENADYFNPQEFKKVLDKCMELLPEKYASVFKLKTIQGVDSKVICNDLNITSSNLWVMLHRSRLQLRECLELNWYKKK